MNLVIGIIVALVVLVALILILRKRKPAQLEKPAAETPTPLPSEKEAAPSAEDKREGSDGPSEAVSVDGGAAAEEAAASDEVAAEDAAKAPESEQKDSESTPIGVRLDEKAEDKAVEALEKERRDRKLKRLRQGLAPTRTSFISKMGNLFSSKKEIDESLLNELEEMLLTSDVGTATSQKLLSAIKDALEKSELSDPDAVWELLRDAVTEILAVDAKPIDVTADKPFVIMVVGVNGVGKTTTIGKLATKYADQGHKVVLAAADTFRAAAVNQLTIWGRRSKAEVVTSKEGADPSSVVFDAVKKAQEIDADIVIADTAGRLHTKQPLMEELKKIGRVMGKAKDGAPHEVLLVLDATTGQNAIQQVGMFKDTLDIDGLVLTKLDGTAKGGVIIGICHEHAIPVRFIGIGESKDDLREFDVGDFVEALFIRESTSSEN